MLDITNCIYNDAGLVDFAYDGGHILVYAVMHRLLGGYCTVECVHSKEIYLLTTQVGGTECGFVELQIKFRFQIY